VGVELQRFWQHEDLEDRLKPSQKRNVSNNFQKSLPQIMPFDMWLGCK
jgi:hypothetical protein